ncbi:hypothetical protein [Dawidia soli]|uniref:Uncharacterized protein n=1 Tax=Dawidia soli TaxID=2782352 RepID=A0AAP2DGN2_9BACT|nr:hypothetical protein [Dawidia soli]MBT1690495.1 hypothetical protein [Dawidia soli]
MKTQQSKNTKVKFIVDKRLDGIDVTKMFPEQLAAANKHLEKIKLPQTK